MDIEDIEEMKKTWCCFCINCGQVVSMDSSVGLGDVEKVIGCCKDPVYYYICFGWLPKLR